MTHPLITIQDSKADCKNGPVLESCAHIPTPTTIIKLIKSNAKKINRTNMDANQHDINAAVLQADWAYAWKVARFVEGTVKGA